MANHHYVFLPNVKLNDQIFYIRETLQKNDNKVGQLFIVFISAYDVVSKEVLCYILAESHTP